MASVNQVTLSGNLGRDPEIKQIASGASVASFSVAVNRSYKTKEGEQKEETDWIDCEAWTKTADLVGQLLHRGDSVLVTGQLRQDKWEQDGQKRSKLKVRVDNFQKLNRKNGEAQVPAEATKTEPAGELASVGAGTSDIPF